VDAGFQCDEAATPDGVIQATVCERPAADTYIDKFMFIGYLRTVVSSALLMNSVVDISVIV
jgi:hypothetical protein